MVQQENREFEFTGSRAKLPRPVPGGTEHIESLGHFIDNLMGDARIRKAVERELEPLYLEKDEAPEDPPPVELPEPSREELRRLPKATGQSPTHSRHPREG
jgi:hypothetical protein